MLVLIARYWNEIEWVRASLKYIKQWNPDVTIICEGNWSAHHAFKGRTRSTDGTREILENFVSENKNTILMDGVICSEDYRTNQAATCKKALRMSGAGSKDWFITIDCDNFLKEKSIEKLKSLMTSESAYYFPCMNNHFLWDTKTCYRALDIHGNLLPRRIHAEADFINANHYGLRGKYYTSNKEIPFLAAEKFGIEGYHYHGIKNDKRREERFLLGDKLKRRPEKFLDKKVPFTGEHPKIVLEVLENAVSK
jgi:hypothetical protein